MEELIRELEELRDKYAELELERQKLQKNVAYYEECLRLSQHRMFASSSEKSGTDARQVLLFDEAENEAGVKHAEPSVEEITYTRRKRNASAETSEEDYDSLPTERVEYTLKDEELVCPECNGKMHLIGFDERA